MKAQNLIREFKKYNLGPYLEVPCSILGSIISQLLKDRNCEIINPPSEAVAMGLAAGSFLATKKTPVILMQNSGLCNTLNSLTSLSQIYHIPALFIISWRGEPNTKDAPEHDIMGIKLRMILNTFDIPYVVITKKDFKREIRNIVNIIKKSKNPAALIIREGVVEKQKWPDSKPSSTMNRSEAVDIIVDASYDKAYFVTTNGFISREAFYNLRKKGIENVNPPFYMLGSMGHAHSIGLGIAKYSKGNKKVVVLDGDGGCLMHLGSMASVARGRSNKLIHVVLDNGTYASTGGQPTVSKNIDFCKIAKGCGYKNIYRITTQDRLKRIFEPSLKKRGPTFMHILISNTEKKTKNQRVSDVYTCRQIKENFIKRLS